MALLSTAFWSPLPEVGWRYTILLVASCGLYLGVARAGEFSAEFRLWTFLGCGAGFALWNGHFQPNHLAAVLLLFLPLTATLFLGRGLRVVPRLQLVLLTGLFGTLLLKTRSRGALLAALLALAVILWLEGRRRFLGFAVFAVLVAAPSFGDWLVDSFVLDGSAQGMTADVVLTGRPAIWNRALFVLGDFPLTGVGPGAFHGVATELYFLDGRVGDAHNLYLQVALDVGIPGLVAFLVFVAAVLRQAFSAIREAPEPGPVRSRRIGILASLLAFLVHGGGEAVAPGTAGAVAFFFLCGLAVAEKPRKKRWGRAWLVVLAAVFFLLPPARELYRPNRAASTAAEALLVDPTRLEEAAKGLWEVPQCRARWLEGVLADRLDRPIERDAAWSELVRCSTRYLGLLEQAQPTNLTLARLAVQAQPQCPESYFYLARTLLAAEEDDFRAIGSFRHGLALDPRDALAWMQLADLLAPRHRRAALDAYREACWRGDPGANACWRGGRLAEELGDLRTAILFYDQSHWSVARRRGEDLRRRVRPLGMRHD